MIAPPIRSVVARDTPLDISRTIPQYLRCRLQDPLVGVVSWDGEQGESASWSKQSANF